MTRMRRSLAGALAMLWTGCIGSDLGSSSQDFSPGGGVCQSGLSGSGTDGGSGAVCHQRYTFAVVQGRTYTVSTCGRSSGDTFLVVSGDCNCSNDDGCAGGGSACTCTATSDGIAVICASTFGSATASWSYSVTGCN